MTWWAEHREIVIGLLVALFGAGGAGAILLRWMLRDRRNKQPEPPTELEVAGHIEISPCAKGKGVSVVHVGTGSVRVERVETVSAKLADAWNRARGIAGSDFVTLLRAAENAGLTVRQLEQIAQDAGHERKFEALRQVLSQRNIEAAGHQLKALAEEKQGLDDARFTIYHPKEVAPGRWDSLLVYAHMAKMQDWVQTDARSRLPPQGYGARTDRPMGSLVRGAEILVVPELPGCRFNPPADRFLWLEDVHRREFRLQADPGMPSFAPGAAVNGRVAFYLASVLVAEVSIWTFVVDQADGPTGRPVPLSGPLAPAMATAAPYGAIFVSYAHNDGSLVARLGAAYKALGMSFLRDQEVLRSGEKWNPRLLALIEQADIFQLFWSHAARQSWHVRQEWHHALQQERANFIRPVYWQRPLPKPPRELKDLHFAYLPLES